MEDFPDFFDPFNEIKEDIDLQFDPDTAQWSLNGEEYQVPEQFVPMVNDKIQNDQDPQPFLKQMLENLMQDEDKEREDTLPKTIFKDVGCGCIYFTDTAFFGSTIRSFQNCTQDQMQGWIIMPAKYCSRIRSRYSNHLKFTPSLFVPPGTDLDNFAQFFE